MIDSEPKLFSTFSWCKSLSLSCFCFCCRRLFLFMNWILIIISINNRTSIHLWGPALLLPYQCNRTSWYSAWAPSGPEQPREKRGQCPGKKATARGLGAWPVSAENQKMLDSRFCQTTCDKGQGFSQVGLFINHYICSGYVLRITITITIIKI